MRRLPSLVLGLAIVGALLAVADAAFTAAAEQRLAERAGRILDARVGAELHGWPLTVHLLRGRVPRVDVVADDVPLGDGEAAIDHLRVAMADVHVRWEDLFGEAEDLPPAKHASFEAELGEASVQALLGLPGHFAAIELRDSLMVLSLAGVADVNADVEAADGLVVVRPRSGLAGLVGLDEIPVDLHDQPGSPYVQQATVTEGSIVLSGVLRDVEAASGD